MQEEDESTQKEGGCMHIQAESMQEDGVSACWEKAVHAGRKWCMHGESGACMEKVVHAGIGRMNPGRGRVHSERKRARVHTEIQGRCMHEDGFRQKVEVDGVSGQANVGKGKVHSEVPAGRRRMQAGRG